MAIAVVLTIALTNTEVVSQNRTTSPARLVPVYVTATDSLGRDVTDLRAEEVSLRANGKPVGPASLSRQTEEISAVVILDTSISMRPYLQAMFDMAAQFFSHLRPRDRAVAAGLDGQSPLSTAFTSNTDELVTQLKSLQTTNTTQFFDAIVTSADALKDEPARRVVFVMTDGDDTASKASFGKALQNLQAHHVMVYGVGVEMVLTANGRVIHRAAPSRAVRRFVEETGGGYFEVKLSTLRVDVNAAIADVFDELHSQYMLTFVPPASDGDLRKLEIATSRPGVSLRARRGYVARP